MDSSILFYPAITPCPCLNPMHMCVGKLTCCFVSSDARISLNLNVVVVEDMKIKIASNIKLCVHGCYIFQKVLEFFEEIRWVIWRAINTNEIPREE